MIEKQMLWETLAERVLVVDAWAIPNYRNACLLVTNYWNVVRNKSAGGKVNGEVVFLQ